MAQRNIRVVQECRLLCLRQFMQTVSLRSFWHGSPRQASYTRSSPERNNCNLRHGSLGLASLKVMLSRRTMYSRPLTQEASGTCYLVATGELYGAARFGHMQSLQWYLAVSIN